jgi:Fe-S-cluster containining protein
MSRQGKSFKQTIAAQLPQMQEFLTSLEDSPPLTLDAMAEEADSKVWQEVECLSCANCCRNMTPQFTPQDMQRLALHFRMSIKMFKEKWLVQNKNGDWVNRNHPCQFLNISTNKCSVYAIRPRDCAGFPHLTKKKTTEYISMHRQNLKFCPATFKFVEKLMERVGL